MFTGEPFVPSTTELPVEFPSSNTSPGLLVVVGGAFVLNQKLSGNVANSSELVAKSALVGTSIKYHWIPPPGMKFVTGPLPFVKVTVGMVKLVLAN